MINQVLDGLSANGENGNDAVLSAVLTEAWKAAAEANYQAALARWLAPRLNGRELDPGAAHIAFEITLLAGRPLIAAEFARDTEASRFLLALARGDVQFEFREHKIAVVRKARTLVGKS